MQVEDATISAAIKCLYNPHASNSECTYLSNLLSSKLDGAPSLNDLSKATPLTNLPQACACSKGFAGNPSYQKVSEQRRGTGMPLLTSSTGSGAAP